MTINRGTSGDDELLGTGYKDIIPRVDGHDQIHGPPGEDTIGGGAGDDLVLVGLGKDIVSGSAGYEKVGAGSANEVGVYRALENIGFKKVPIGGKGRDTLRSKLTRTQLSTRAVRNDLNRIRQFPAAQGCAAIFNRRKLLKMKGREMLLASRL